MKKTISKIRIISALMLMAILGLAITSCQKAGINPNENSLSKTAPTDIGFKKADTIPAILQVPVGNKLTWHAYATGTQIYQVQQSITDPMVYSWVFIAPAAKLYSDQAYMNEVGIHYLGPTWEATAGPKNGMVVVGAKLQAVTEDATAIPWLLLQATVGSNFSKVTYIQRLYTAGGLAPTNGADQDHLGQLDSIPYTAQYFFYTAEN